jgi:ubiquinone/menaquinone biosynthesis C-methylase UbiE
MNACHLAFPSDTFDRVLSGFMGWYDCFYFKRFEFTQPDQKGSEILRVLRKGGRFFCCSWEEQDDLRWMEEAMLRYYPQLLDDPEYLADRPIGMAYEKAPGYEIILRKAGFREIETHRLAVTCLSKDAEEWWHQMLGVGWKSLLAKIQKGDEGQYRSLKSAILADLLQHQPADGIQFQKVVFFVSGMK